jgi:hypothetical protein
MVSEMGLQSPPFEICMSAESGTAAHLLAFAVMLVGFVKSAEMMMLSSYVPKSSSDATLVSLTERETALSAYHYRILRPM